MMHSAASSSDRPSGRSLVTVENALWILVAVVALVLRLVSLGSAPLNESEAREAMLALRAATGQGMPRGDYSPVLLALNGLLFFICGTSDGLARLWPALSGSALVLVPFLLRRRVGRFGALGAGLYLAFSPTALLASRQLDGTMVTAAGVMLSLGSLARFFDTDKRLWLTWAAVGLALAVTASSSAYGLLLPMGLAWLALAWAWPHKKTRSLWDAVQPHWGHALVVFVCAAFAFATGLGWHFPGLGGAGALLPAWFARFGLDSAATTSPLTLVAVYEPLALIGGLGGILWAVWSGHRLGVYLGLWAGLGTLLLSLMPARTPLDVLWVVVPLALLVGLVAESLQHRLRSRRTQPAEWLFALVMVMLWAYVYLRLVRYGVVGASLDLYLALLALALQVFMAAIIASGYGLDSVLRAAVLGGGVVLVVVTISVGWGITYARPADPRELLVSRPSAAGVRDLAETLQDLSWHRTGAQTTLPFAYIAPSDSVLAWYLRDFAAARRVERLHTADPAELGSVIVTAGREFPSADAAAYVGQGFVVHRTWNPSELSCTWSWPPQCAPVVRWLLSRGTPTSPVADQWATLWLRQEELGHD
jgi:uncharacterized protein (TIGR03663 family)